MAAHSCAPGAGITEGANVAVERLGAAADGGECTIPTLALQREAQRLHACGPEPTTFLLAEALARLDALDADWLWRRLNSYTRFSPDLLDALDARDLPQPFGEIGGGG